MESLFDAIHIPEVQERAEEYLRTLSRHIFTLEARRTLAKDASLRRYPSHLFSLYLDAFPHGLARADQKQLKKAAEIMRSIVHDFVPISYTIGLGHQDTLPILHMIATRFSTMCFEDAWIRKSAGSTGIMIMTSTPDIGERWIMSREVDIVRTLLHVLKDSPHDPPRNVQEVIDNLVRVLRLTHATIRAQVDIEGTNSHYQIRVPFLISIFFLGDTITEPSCSSDISPVHKVTVRTFWETCRGVALAVPRARHVVDLLEAVTLSSSSPNSWSSGGRTLLYQYDTTFTRTDRGIDATSP